MKTVLVTGCCGFIGSHFVRLLRQLTDWRIVNLDNVTGVQDRLYVEDNCQAILNHQDWVERATSGEYRTYYEDVYLHTWRHRPT